MEMVDGRTLREVHLDGTHARPDSVLSGIEPDDVKTDRPSVGLHLETSRQRQTCFDLLRETVAWDFLCDTHSKPISSLFRAELQDPSD